MKKNKIKILLAMLVICTSMISCNKTAEDLSSSEIDIKVETQTSTKSEETEKEIEVTEEEKSSAEDPRYVPKGEKVSDDIPLNSITFADEGETLFNIDISDCTLADLIETAEQKAIKDGKKISMEVSSEGMVEQDSPELYLHTQSFEFGGERFDVETMIGDKIVSDISSYEPSDSKYTNPNTSYSEMKIKNLNLSRTITKKEVLSFCGGEIGFGTLKEDVEKLLGKGKEFVVNKGESNEKTMYVWKNKKSHFSY